MNNFGERGSKKPSVVRRIVVGIVLVAAAGVLFHFRDNLSNRISKVFASTEKDPIPRTKLEKQNFSLTVTANGEIVGLEAVAVNAPNTSSGMLTIAWLKEEGRFVNSGDPVVRFDNTDALLRLEQRQNTLESNRENTKLETYNQTTDEKTQALDQKSAEEDYQYALKVMKQDETIFSKWDIIEAQSDIHFQKENLEFLKSRGKTQKRNARSKQQILTIDRNKAQNEVDMYKRTLESLEITAPVGGMVLYYKDRREDPKVGDNTFPGRTIIEIVNLDALQAKIYVLERDGGNLAKGQPVNIKLDAIPDKVFHGEIRSVSSVAAALERNSPLRYFTCEVSISDAGRDLKRIRPGMSLRADVVLHNYEDCFVVPSGALAERGDETVVYVKNGEDFDPRVVKTGMSSHGEVVILEGVKEGEIIALVDPNGSRKLTLPDFSKGTQMGGPGGMPGMPPMMPPGGMMMMRGGPR